MAYELLDWLTALATTAFRIGVYIALRWIPAHQAIVGIPFAFALSFAGWFANDAKLQVLERQTARAMEANSAAFEAQNGKINANTDANGEVKIKTIGNGVTRDDVIAATNVRDEVTLTKTSNGGTQAESPAASYAAVVRAGTEVKQEAGVDGDSQALSPLDPSPDNPKTTTSPPVTTSHPLAIPPRPSVLHLLTGATTSSRSFNWLTLALNLLIATAYIDAIYFPYLFQAHADLAFSRIGAVGPTWVKLSARVPPHRHARSEDKEYDPLDEREGARVLYRMTRPLGQWQIGPEVQVTNVSDWVGTVTVDYLLPSTEYEYQLSLPLEPTKRHPLFPKKRLFKTAPDPRSASAGQTHYTFASTSCIKPGFPYSPFRAHNAIPGARHLAKTIRDEAVDFVMFLGDFIYADVPRYPDSDVESYNKRYRQVYASKDWQEVIESTPTMHIYDDHEILNDWSGKDNVTSPSPIFASANSAYATYLGDANPPSVSANTNYYTYSYGDSAFFVWDARRYRTYNHAPDDESKTVLGIEQKLAFVRWLAEVNQTVTFKFVVSSAPFMTLWKSARGGPANDTWAGFQTERSELMDIMQWVPNIIVLSGDRHEFAAATIRNSVLEVSTSPLSFFYIPLVRTLQQENGLGRTGEEALLKYLPVGIAKYTTFEVDGRVLNRPTVTLKVWVDGKEEWRLQILGKPVHRTSNAVGAMRKSLRELFRRLIA